MENYKNFWIEIVPDDNNDDSPRDWDNLGTIVWGHKRYTLGGKEDIEVDSKYPEAEGWDEVKAEIVKEYKPSVILPVYMYDHSGITIKTTPFGDRWDSGQIGWIFVTPEKLRTEYSVKKITGKILEMAKTVLISEINTFDQHLTGDVYGYRIYKDEGGDEEVDSCYGFYGEGYCLAEAKDVVDSYQDQHAEEQKVQVDKGIRKFELVNQITAWITDFENVNGKQDESDDTLEGDAYKLLIRSLEEINGK